MARSRNIKPGFFKNDRLVELPFEYRLLFAGLWTLADRDGKLEDRPKRIRMELFPADDVNVDEGMNELQAAGFITRYHVDDLHFIKIDNFSKHQNPHHKEAASTIPDPEICPGLVPTCKANQSEADPRHALDCAAVERGVNRADSLIPDSLIPDYRKAQAPLSARRPAQHEIPPNFAVSPAIREWADRNNFDRLEERLEHFIGYAKANGKRYSDWDQAFRNAVRDDWAKLNWKPRAAIPSSAVMSVVGDDDAT